MTNQTLADDYLKRAQIRLKALYTLRDEGGYADVVRESQELVELAFYGDEDYLPSQQYTPEDAGFFIGECEWLIQSTK